MEFIVTNWATSRGRPVGIRHITGAILYLETVGGAVEIVKAVEHMGKAQFNDILFDQSYLLQIWGVVRYRLPINHP